jgi:hypothetical protein
MVTNESGDSRMTDKKEQARKLREAAVVLKELGRGNAPICWLQEELADELDPPVKERWKQVRDAAHSVSYTPDAYWRAAIAEANKGMVSKEELRGKAPWFSGGSGPGFSPRDYDQGIAAFLRVIDSL